MTDIEALRARMREAAEKAAGSWPVMYGTDYIDAVSPANVKALDAGITRLREDNDWLRENRNKWQDATTVARRRAEAAEAALAKRDEEVARLRETMRAASVYLRKLEDNMLANDADMMLDDCLPPSFHADQIDQALTKEPPHAG